MVSHDKKFFFSLIIFHFDSLICFSFNLHGLCFFRSLNLVSCFLNLYQLSLDFEYIVCGPDNVEEVLILLVEQHLLPGQLKAVFQLMCSFSFSSSCLSPLPSHMCITFFLILAGFARGTSE